jgi:hypothetical protein
MSYSQIRKYFKAQIATVKPSFKEWRDSLVFDDAQNIPSTLIDTHYHIQISSWTSTGAQDRSVQDSFSVVVTFFKNGFKKPTDALDLLLDDVLCIRQAIVNPINVDEFKETVDGNIEAVENSSGSSVEINSTNDNTIKIALEFNVRLYFSVI